MPSKVTKSVARPKRSKPEMQQEFEEIQGEMNTARETSDSKSEEAARSREAEVRQAVDGISAERVVQKISGLGLEVSKALSGLSNQLLEEVERLADVREAVALEQNELGRLHKIDVAATALDQLVQDYARQKEQLEAEISARRAEWEDESRQTERDQKEQEELLKKQRQREIEEYEYKKTLERKKAQDKYEEERKLLERQNQERQEALEKAGNSARLRSRSVKKTWRAGVKIPRNFPCGSNRHPSRPRSKLHVPPSRSSTNKSFSSRKKTSPINVWLSFRSKPYRKMQPGKPCRLRLWRSNWPKPSSRCRRLR